MKPVTVSVEVPNPPQHVYDFLEVLGNHERFMDHFMVDWELSGPRRAWSEGQRPGEGHG